MFQIEIDRSQLEDMAKEALAERMKEIENEVFFMDSKQLSNYLNMSWNSIVTHLMSDSRFPAIRLGQKWLFPRRDVVTYMQKFYEAVRDNGGDIHKFVRK